MRIIAGPTASGKSQLALDIAKDGCGVIINADSQQVYRALPILTAQPSPEEQADVPHRLYGFAAGDEALNAAAWAKLAASEIETAWKEKRLPVVVGGTGLYLRTLMNGISPVPEVDAAVRAEVRARMQEIGSHAFHAELAREDTQIAKKLRPSDPQRLMRAMEVLKSTGKSLLYWQSIPAEPLLPMAQFEMQIVTIPRPELYRRCNARFVKMVEQGAVEEVRRVMMDDRWADGQKNEKEESIFIPPIFNSAHQSSPLSKIIGVRELAAYIRGETSLDEAITKAQQMTRNYAKRQMTWFRNQYRATLK